MYLALSCRSSRSSRWSRGWLVLQSRSQLLGSTGCYDEAAKAAILWVLTATTVLLPFFTQGLEDCLWGERCLSDIMHWSVLAYIGTFCQTCYDSKLFPLADPLAACPLFPWQLGVFTYKNFKREGLFSFFPHLWSTVQSFLGFHPGQSHCKSASEILLGLLHTIVFTSPFSAQP